MAIGNPNSRPAVFLRSVYTRLSALIVAPTVAPTGCGDDRPVCILYRLCYKPGSTCRSLKMQDLTLQALTMKDCTLTDQATTDLYVQLQKHFYSHSTSTPSAFEVFFTVRLTRLLLTYLYYLRRPAVGTTTNASRKERV